jgi:hypothetical protein
MFTSVMCILFSNLMTEHKYNWKRFFRPREARENNLDPYNGGYLYDPDTDSTWAKFHNHDLKAFDSVVDISCLIILEGICLKSYR